ncbi:unnamed protein product [Psylliodes chrysocephalus]|uniref:Diuretic hormone receptor n=1 Tax=Psylliodes chrysocephalus TaxID=3402493 RepID=A0A9P0CIS6_9CUCU|nr:unnamed protein product [Psylliodes chrysocephala]
MSWEQDSGPADHDIPNESLYRFAISNMYMYDEDYDDNPVSKTIEDCKAEFQNQTDYLQQHYRNGFCNVTFDSVMCWPPTPYNETATIKCFKYLFSIRYNDTQNATRKCENGNWTRPNYDMCKEIMQIPEDNAIQTLLYFLGFTLSLVTLVIAVTIFIYFKELHCLRNKIHVNLMFSYIIMYSTWIVMLILINHRDDSIIVCGFGTTLLHYSHVSTFFWMFVEGFYLYNLVVTTFRNKIFKLRIYASIGWGIPLISIVIWAVIKSFLSKDGNCPWLYDDSIDWIYLAPPLLVVFLNLIFLFSIMWVLITKLRSSTGVEHQQHYKAARALLVLIPLLGVTWVITIYVPSDNLRNVFESLRSILLSTQGLTISLCYCFLNTEVQNIIKHHFENWKARRSLGSHLGRKSTDWHSGMNNNRHTEWTLVSASEVEAATPNNHNTETTETTETAEMKNEEG